MGKSGSSCQCEVVMSEGDAQLRCDVASTVPPLLSELVGRLAEASVEVLWYILEKVYASRRPSRPGYITLQIGKCAIAIQDNRSSFL